MKKRLVTNIINQCILWPIMEIAILPIFLMLISLTSFLLINEPPEMGWVFILLMIPFGVVDGGGLAPAFLIRLWGFTVNTIGQTTYFLIIAPIITYIYFQLSEFLMMLIFKRDIGKIILKQNIVTTCGGTVTRKIAIKRGFYKWNIIVFSPLIALASIIKKENLFYDKEIGLFYWDIKTGTQIECL